MGKDKNSQRTKNNARPSSSGRSAEMLGSAPINPFMSFSSLKESMGVDEQMADSHLDPNFQVVLKKMNKKDGVTKLKALQEFAQLCGSSEPDQVLAILPFWPRLYSLLALDVEHRVREASHVAHRSVVSKVKRNIAPYLKQLAGPWFVAQCDTYAPAASAATLAFNEAFPPKKMSEAIAFCQEEILNFIYENLIVHTPQTLCNAKTMTPEEIESKYIRTLISSLQGYALYLTRLSGDQLISAREMNQKLVSDAKFWKLNKHQSPQVRGAWFSALIALCQNAQFFILGEEKRIGQAVFGSLDESDATVLSVVWEATLVALIALEGLLEAVSFEKLVLPKLLRVCREGGKGSAAAIFPSLLPLLSKMPGKILKDTNTFHGKFFSSIQTGFNQRTVQLSLSESKAVANAFVECLQYVIQLNQDNEALGQELLKNHLLPCLCETIQTCKKTHASEALYYSISRLLHSWGRSSEDSVQQKHLHSFCSDLTTELKRMALQEQLEEAKEPVNSNSMKETDSEALNNLDVNEIPLKREPLPLKSVLKSQVDFITCMLEKQSRPMKVKFADLNVQDLAEESSPEESKYIPSAVTYAKVQSMAKALCSCYMQAVMNSECVDYLTALASLSKVLSLSSLYSDLAKSVNISSEEELFSQHLITWLQPKSTLFCHAAVSFCVPLLAKLPVEQQNQLFDQLLKSGLDVHQLLWLVEENVLCGGAASTWLRSPQLTPVIKQMTELALMSDTALMTTWDLLSSGFSIADDGDHVFCHATLEDVLSAIVIQWEDTVHSSAGLPQWTSVAANIITKLYIEQSPYLRTMSSPERVLSVAFQICLWEHHSLLGVEALSSLWKNGTRALARTHGHSSSTVLQLCSAFVDAVLMLLYGKSTLSKDDLTHVASQLAQFVEIVTDSFVNIDEDKERKAVCSTLLTSLFSNKATGKEGEEKGLKGISILHRRGIESLADCVEPFHIGIDSSQIIPRSPLIEIVGAGYWGAIVAFALHQLSSVPSFKPFVDEGNEDHLFFALDIFLEMFVVLNDVKYISDHFSFTELGNSLHRLSIDTKDTIKEIISTLSSSQRSSVHDILQELSYKSAAHERAHRAWHVTYSCNTLSEDCNFGKISHIPLLSIDDNSLQNIDLSNLDVISDYILANGLSEEIRPHATVWLDAVYKLQIQCNWRFVSNNTIDGCALAVVCDTLHAVKFLRAIVTCGPELLSSRNWDQVMIAMATWIHCAYETIMGKHDVQDGISHLSRKVCTFLQEVCNLFLAFNKNLFKLNKGSIELVDAERGSLKESLPREWLDVFAGECEHKILALWTDIVENLKPSDESPPLVALLTQLGLAIQSFSIEFLRSSKGGDVMFEPVLKLAPPLLLHNLGSVRLAAFHLIFKIIPYMVKHDAAIFANINNADEENDSPINSEERLSLLHLEDVLAHAQTVVSTMLSDAKLGTCCTVQPFTDSYTYTTGYLLVWSLILDMCKEAETELTCQYAIWLKNSSENYAETLLNNIFRLLPQEAFDEKMKKSLDYFSTQAPNILSGARWTSGVVQYLACNDLFGVLSCLPALARQWWTNSDAKSATLIDRVVSKHFSPHICTAEMCAVAKMQDKTVENMTVRVHSNVREVVATYTVDDLVMELVVRLPTNHPLSPMIVEVGKRNAAAAVQWRRWLMQLTMFLTHQNGTLWDGLALWRNNVVRRYEGVEECYICFCVLSGANYQLPKLSCRTCRKKFHSTCLYKWFQTSNKSTCPICRNLF
ncbi:E3 ubiquitin-protein ligase listerin [Frankliniella occidentalis]|uniref:E3 ubiquitin-protein ligase listerin n=1 Tax=Frankliniella occidentalis TaxID=133901 RepID=A0A6J1TF89_FRAOC|nr:E3 ubiquitin-protein ligase listerin [Frankliniella occidentalis]XP_026292155.1 E3 ubiquitin-protein ligase listerin [Frankliniella occidentalis]XP_052129457.1 E3 ubiquitin-protein ligase listerin [Frankliniella occidentalis]